MKSKKISEILRDAVAAEATLAAKHAVEGPHPISAALRDISIGLEATGRWCDFVHPPTGQMILHASATGSPHQRCFSAIEVRSWRPGLSREEDRLTEIVSLLLIRRGMIRVNTLPGPLVSVCNPSAVQMSNHERLAIVGQVLADIVSIEAM